MAITGSEIRVRRTPSFDVQRAALIAAALVLALAIGTVVGRATAPTAPRTDSSVVSTRWIDDTSVRTDVMRAFNGIDVDAVAPLPHLDIESVRQRVMDEMNGLASPSTTLSPTRSSVRTAVMRHMNQLLAS